jgi:hypothetical protein
MSGMFVCTTCFNHVVIKISHLFLQSAACQTSTLLETEVGATANATGINGLTFLAKHSELEIINFGHPSYD